MTILIHVIMNSKQTEKSYRSNWSIKIVPEDNVTITRLYWAHLNYDRWFISINQRILGESCCHHITRKLYMEPLSNWWSRLNVKTFDTVFKIDTCKKLCPINRPPSSYRANWIDAKAGKIIWKWLIIFPNITLKSFFIRCQLLTAKITFSNLNSSLNNESEYNGLIPLSETVLVRYFRFENVDISRKWP